MLKILVGIPQEKIPPETLTRKWKYTIKLVLAETGCEGCDESGQDPIAAVVNAVTNVMFPKKQNFVFKEHSVRWR
jgi:hypothetical protein